MADQDVIIAIGSSNMAGYNSNLYEVPLSDYIRWFSQLVPTAATPERPYVVQASGVRMWTPRRPYSTNEQRPIAAISGGDTVVTYSGTAISPTPTEDQWLFVLEGTGELAAFNNSSAVAATVVTVTAHGLVDGTLVRVTATSGTLNTGTGYAENTNLYIVSATANTFGFSTTPGGAAISLTDTSGTTTVTWYGVSNLRKITLVAGSDITVDPAFSPAPVFENTVVVLLDSHTIDNIDSTSLIVEKTALSPDFTADAVGRFVSFFDSPVLGETTRKIVDWTTTTITMDYPLSGTLPAAGTGFCVLSGANACEGMDSMQPPNAVLQNLQFTLSDTPPVYLTGLDYSNWDFTPFGSPRSLSRDPTMNSITELAWQVRSKIGSPLVCLEIGVSASMISPFALGPQATSTLMGPMHDSTELGYHPSIPAGIYTILVNAITSMRTLIEAEGNTMKVRGIFINLFDNDPSTDTQRTYRLRANTELLRDSLRSVIGDDNVPWIMSGPSHYAGGAANPVNAFVYDELFAIAADDSRSGVADTRVGFTYCVEDDLHLNALGQIRLAQEFFKAWEPIHDHLVGFSPVIEICNRALSAIGEAPNVTSLDPPEGSAHAQLCETLFDEAVRVVADSRHWSFADRRVTLDKVRVQLPLILDATSNLITTATSHGLVVGSPVSFAVGADGSGAIPTPLVAGTIYYVATAGPRQFNVTATVGGLGTAIVFTSVGSGAWRCFKESDRAGSGFMFAVPPDCRTERGVVPVGAPDDWPGMDGSLLGTPYAGIGVVTTSRSGFNYAIDGGGFGSTRPIPWKRALSRGGDQVIYTDLEEADLVYSRNLDDPKQWPPLFQEAVMFQLASGLAGAIKRDVKIVDWCLGRAQAFISEAARVDGQRVVEREQQRYPWAR